MIMCAIANIKDELRSIPPLLSNLLHALPKNIHSLSLYHIYLLTLISKIPDQTKTDLSNALNAKLSKTPINHLDTLELWSLYKINQILGDIKIVDDPSFRATLEKQIRVACQPPAQMQLNEILEHPNLKKQLEALPQESSELQNSLRQNGVYDALMTQIHETFPDAELEEEEIVQGHSLDLTLISKTGKFKLNIELDGQHHKWALQQSKDQLRDALLKKEGWSVLRIPNSDLKGKTPKNQTATLFALIQEKLATHKKASRGFRPECQQAAHPGGGRHGDRTGYQRKGRGRGRWRGRG